MRGLGEIARLCAIAAPHDRRRHPRRRGARRPARRHRRRRPGQGRADRGAPGRRDRDPQRRRRAGARRWPRAAPRRVLTFGDSSGADVRVARRRARRPRPGRRSPSHTPWGTDARAPRRQRPAHGGRTPPPRWPSPAWSAPTSTPPPRALAGAGLSPMRMELRRARVGRRRSSTTAYNANPTSMRAALDALAALPATGACRRARRDGRDQRQPRPSTGRSRAEAERLGIEVIAVGTDLYGVAPVDDPVAAVGALAGGDAVLVKGSRVVGLERLGRRPAGHVGGRAARRSHHHAQEHRPHGTDEQHPAGADRVHRSDRRSAGRWPRCRRRRRTTATSAGHARGRRPGSGRSSTSPWWCRSRRSRARSRR